MRSLEVGARAPEIVPIISLAGRPRVLAFVREWTATVLTASDRERIRAQLRGLGADLTIVSGRGAWSLRPDDALEAIETDRSGLAAKRYGVGGARDAVFVIGGDGVIRFSHVFLGPCGDALGMALEAAVDAMLGRRSVPITLTRREWTTSCLVTGFAVALFAGCRSDRAKQEHDEPKAIPAPAPEELDIVLDINGKKRALKVDPRTSLLDALRERLGLVGTKKGCDGGQCGACTVIVGGQRVVSCLTLAAMAEGQPIQTIEGLGTADALHPMQAAFIEHDAFQCGFCTPGQIMSAVALVKEDRAHTDDEVREQMSGNICRCGAYPNIIAAVRAARRA